MTKYYWTPKRIKELKERGYKLHFVKNDLTKLKKCDKENSNEKIQNNTSGHGNLCDWDNNIPKRITRTNTRTNRK